LKQGVTYNIDVISATGRPLEPKKHYTKFINQCGVVVRDNVPITVQEWHEPKKARVGFTFVNKRTKKECWRKLMEHFILPPEFNKYDEEGNEVPGGRERRRLVKEFALQKMAEAFRNFKKNLARDYVDKKKTPDFNGQYEKLKDDWPEFVRQKQSEHFKAISEKNKANAAKKTYNHIMGPGGYRLSEPKWQKMEDDLREREIPLGTEGWDPRAKSWWYGHGGSLDPVTGECVHRYKTFKPTQDLIDAMTNAQEGKIRFNRENDALTLALGNPEHGGRVRGKGAIPWKVGFSQENDPYSYRSRKRKTDRDADLVGHLASELYEMKKIVTELVKERSSARPHEDHPADVGSQQRRSSVASTEAPPADANAPLLAPAGANAPTIDITAPEPPRYPVDDVKEMKECELHYPMGNISMKVAIGSALPCIPGALHHNNPIADGYARVTVEDIVQGCEDLEIDYPTPEGDVKLRDVKRQFILWKKKFIKFPGDAGASSLPPSRQPTPPSNPPPAGKQTPPPSPPPAGTPPPNPPPAKKQKQSWTINPDPYVPKTTKVPEPSLKPLIPRPWERSVEETNAAAAAHLEKWKADMKAKREPEPKPVFSEKEKKWAKSFLTTPSQAEKNMPDDYGRELRRQAEILKAEKEKESKKCGKQVDQLGEQRKQSIPPLIVQAAGPDAMTSSFRADMDKDFELMDPAIIAAAAAQGMTVTGAREKAAEIGMTLRAVLGLEEAPMSAVVITYVPNGPLVEPAQEESLPAQMQNLLRWYKGFIKNKADKEYIYAEVRHEHHFKHYYVQVHMSELFQLFNLRELDKSILSCYVL
jgi:hypothetical protein